MVGVAKSEVIKSPKASQTSQRSIPNGANDDISTWAIRSIPLHSKTDLRRIVPRRDTVESSEVLVQSDDCLRPNIRGGP